MKITGSGNTYKSSYKSENNTTNVKSSDKNIKTERYDSIEISPAFRNSVSEAKASESMTMNEYRQYIHDKISAMPMSKTSLMDNISIGISDKGFEKMKNDPDYENWVLNCIKNNFDFVNPFSDDFGGLYIVHTFGEAKEDYLAQAWYPEYKKGKGSEIYNEKKKEGFWEQRLKRHKYFMELKEEYNEKHESEEKAALVRKIKEESFFKGDAVLYLSESLKSISADIRYNTK